MHVVVFLYLSLISAAFANHTHHLRYVNFIFRHGDRNPIYTFPFDGHPDANTWPEGLEQLTQIGIEQHYIFGKWLWSRYQNFLPKEYNFTLFIMRSTDVDRTLMSGTSLLAGLFHKSKSSLDRYGLQWRPIPVHPVPATSGVLLSSKPCPMLEKLVDDCLDSNETINVVNKHHTLFETLQNVTGMANVTQHNLWIITDDLICIESHNLTVPSWYTSTFKEELMLVSNYLWEVHYTDPTILRLEAGLYINDAIERMKSVMAGNSSVERIEAVSGHDSNVAAILGALGLYKNESMPAYAACIIFELVGPEPPAPLSAYRLKVLYKRSWSDLEGEYLTLPACANSSRPATEGCEFDKVMDQLQPMILSPDQFEAACRLPDSYSHDFLIILIVFGVLLAASGVVISVFVCVLRRKKEYFINYSRLSNDIAA